MTVQGCRSAGHLDQRLDVLDLPVHRVRERIAAIAPAPAVIAEYGQLQREQRTQRGLAAAGTHRAVDEDQRRAGALLLVGDHGAVRRCH